MAATLEHDLGLDAGSIDPAELSIPALMRELNLQQRPSWLLRKLMNMLESKRQAKGMGWSRPWNKIGVTVFRTHKHVAATDSDYLCPFMHLLEPLLANASEEARTFAASLLRDENLLCFTFFHNRVDGDRQFEGLTLSLGRIVGNDRSKRDRIDLILEDRRNSERVDGIVDLARVFICPWSRYQKGRAHELLEWHRPTGEDKERFDTLYSHAVEYYHRWKSDDSRQWSHWASNYIEYFGPRTFIPQGTSFF